MTHGLPMLYVNHYLTIPINGRLGGSQTHLIGFADQHVNRSVTKRLYKAFSRNA